MMHWGPVYNDPFYTVPRRAAAPSYYTLPTSYSYSNEDDLYATRLRQRQLEEQRYRQALQRQRQLEELERRRAIEEELERRRQVEEYTARLARQHEVEEYRRRRQALIEAEAERQRRLRQQQEEEEEDRDDPTTDLFRAFFGGSPRRPTPNPARSRSASPAKVQPEPESAEDEDEEMVNIDSPTLICEQPELIPTSQTDERTSTPAPPELVTATPLSEPPTHTQEDLSEAALKVQRFYCALRTIRSLSARFEDLKSSFTMPSHLGFTHPSSGDVITLPASSSSSSSTGFTEEAKEGAAKLAYTPTNTPVHYQNEQLARLLTQLDAVDSFGIKIVREKRKALARKIEEEAEQLESVWRGVWGRYVRSGGEVKEEVMEEKVDMDMKERESGAGPEEVPLPPSPTLSSHPATLPESDAPADSSHSTASTTPEPDDEVESEAEKDEVGGTLQKPETDTDMEEWVDVWTH